MQTHAQYIRDFATSQRAPKYAYAMVSRECPPPPLCEWCKKGGMSRPTWRCDSCDEQRYQCKACMAVTHMRTPFHLVQWYNNECERYERACLRDAGVFLTLCRSSGGKSCRSAPCKPEVPDGFWHAPPPLFVTSDSPPSSQRERTDDDLDTH